MYVEGNGFSKILWLSFLFVKKSLFEKMGEFVTAKAIHVLHLEFNE